MSVIFVLIKLFFLKYIIQLKDYQLSHHETRRTVRKYPVSLLANDFFVPMNVGSLFRIADAFGVEKIYLCGDSPVPPNKKINKTARSTVKAVTYEYQENALETVNKLKKDGYTIVSLEITKHSIDIQDFEMRPTDKICLIIGAESSGVAQELLEASDAVVHIPMFGQNSSMNVATATSVAVFEIVKIYLSV